MKRDAARRYAAGIDADPATDLIRLKSDVAWQHVAGEVVALDLGSAAYVLANDTGALLWPLVAEGTTTQGLVEKLTAHFPIGPERARADVRAFVDQLRTLALVEGPE